MSARAGRTRRGSPRTACGRSFSPGGRGPARSAILQFAADENFNNIIVRGLFRRRPDLDLVRIQDVGLSGADDRTVLEWGAREGRIVISHDVSTMSRVAWERVAAGQLMAGLFEVSRAVPVGRAIEDLLLIAEYSLPGEWEGQVLYLPLR